MKRGIICIMIVIGLTSLAIASYAFINTVSDEVIGKLELVEKHFDSEEYEAAVKLAAEASDKWGVFCKNSYLITDKNNADEISSSLSHILVLIKERNDEVIVECESALVLLRRFKDRQRVSISNLL